MGFCGMACMHKLSIEDIFQIIVCGVFPNFYLVNYFTKYHRVHFAYVLFAIIYTFFVVIDLFFLGVRS